MPAIALPSRTPPAHRGLRRTGEEAAAGALLHRLAGLRADPLLDEAVGLSVARAGLAFDMGELGEQAVNGLLVVAIR
ncbi:hypothetical protein [Sinorhizobium sp. NFACC03]|uniref:hypothetical protein n=1 Tax=Sinorhizobium sp. NFACC03 TaxID=1566295 RepID=UPI0008823D3E|nr:hypothetical protein [Sinorhizobium sp. NFACC03]SDA80980.1 hypothetical protein SAMN03159448_03283 [Sinorhizobium sp. NFACC03]